MKNIGDTEEIIAVVAVIAMFLLAAFSSLSISVGTILILLKLVGIVAILWRTIFITILAGIVGLILTLSLYAVGVYLS